MLPRVPILTIVFVITILAGVVVLAIGHYAASTLMVQAGLLITLVGVVAEAVSMILRGPRRT